MASALVSAEAALERGDYRYSLSLLEPLAQQHSVNEQKGASIRMLMVTAWMGQGEEGKAISTCRELTKCQDTQIRQEARQLLAVLEAPTLERPKNWSVELPNLGSNPLVGKNQFRRSKSKGIKKASTKPLPPTGPTKALGIGFSTLTIIIFICLTLLLSS